MGRNKLPVVEVFKSIQGEGTYQGRFALFVRLGLCNLRCKFCDTTYALKPSKGWRNMLPDELAHELWQKYPDALPHLAITGGEPMLHENLIFELLKIVSNRVKTVEIETNGTILPKTLYKFSFITFNVSPKLSNSGEKKHKRIIEEALDFYSNLENVYFKFVIANESDIKEVIEIKDRFYIPQNRIFLMPMASTKRELLKNSKIVLNLAIRYGFNYSCRIQIEASGRRKRGI